MSEKYQISGLLILLFLFSVPICANQKSKKTKKPCTEAYALLGQPNEWSSFLTTDPRHHDPKKFVYLVHSMHLPIERFIPWDEGKILGEKSFLEDSKHILNQPDISASLITNLETGTLTQGGIILGIKSSNNIMAAYHTDMFIQEGFPSQPTPEQLDKIQAKWKTRNLLRSPLEIMQRLRQEPDDNVPIEYPSGFPRTHNYNEVYVATTGRDGKGVDIQGVFIKTNADGKPLVGPFTLSVFQRFCRTHSLPLIRIQENKETEIQYMAPSLNSFNKLIGKFYERVFRNNFPSSHDFQQALDNNHLLLHDKNAFFEIDGKKKSGVFLGEGAISNVIGDNQEQVTYKFPKTWQDAPAIMAEGMLYEYLLSLSLPQKFFGIEYDFTHRLVPILEMGPLGSYIKKPRLDKTHFGSEIANLSSEQIADLKVFFNLASELARKRDVALDLKAENLYWDKDHWLLIDYGARRSYRPYGFTSDLPNFEAYLKVWRQSDPPNMPGVTFHDLRN